MDEEHKPRTGRHKHIRITVGDRSLVVLRTPGQGSRLEALTPAEQAVAALVSQGLSNAQIAQRRGRSPRTIANQVRSIYIKLGIGSRQQLVRLLSENIDT